MSNKIFGNITISSGDWAYQIRCSSAVCECVCIVIFVNENENGENEKITN